MRGSAHDLNIRGAFLHMAADALVSAGVVLAGALGDRLLRLKGLVRVAQSARPQPGRWRPRPWAVATRG